MRITIKKENRQWLGFLGITLILATAFVFAWYLKTQVSDLSFQEGQCGFSKTFHLYCPGCGGTRAVKHLLDLEVIPSLLSNPIPIYAIALVIRIWIALLHNVFCCREEASSVKRWKLFYQWEMWTILVVVIGFFILRNVALAAFGWDYLGDMAGYW